jgi:chromatin segregation and condensation protein Rec8/ScpA/Scc1 (kleisin family)
VKQHAEISFSTFISSAANRTEAIVSFLALLELVKQRFVNVDQGDIFHDIVIRHHPDAPSTDPFVESFV